MLSLALIIGVAFLLRIYGINWDQGMHQHPDERMLVMVADRIEYFSNLNPDFFNYGSLPVYILSAANQILKMVVPLTQSDYDSMLIIGRIISVIVDLAVIAVIYKVGRLLFRNPAAATYAAGVYAIMFFPIQNAHFFIVDPFLNLFILYALYRTFIYIKSPGKRNIALMAVPLAAAAATKVTAILFYPVLFAAIVYTHRKKILSAIPHLVIFHVLLVVFHFVFMPYAYLEYREFIKDILFQTRMNRDAYVFPYTLQYVGTLPYLYYLKNMALWGVGPALFTAACAGLILIVRLIKNTRSARLILFFAAYLLYFIVIGRSAVKFMRYMLPLYPVIALSAGLMLASLVRARYKFAAIGIVSLAIVWSALFINIYSYEHSRIAATRWILSTIPSGSRITGEHWDEVLPLVGADRYVIQQLPLYDQPDNEEKWQKVNAMLDNTDYYIIASNRLSTPLRTLRSCHTGKACYPLTASHYDALMNGTHEFKKVAEFTSYPRIDLGFIQLEIPDQSADESFTVYDHPVITIFRKI